MHRLWEWWFNAAPDTEYSIRFNQALEGWQIFLLSCFVVLFVLWIYSRDGRGSASSALRTFLGGLRALLIAMALLILTEPVLLETHVETRRSTVVVLVDDSYSMDLPFADVEEGLRKRLQTAMGHTQVTLKGNDGKLETVPVEKLEPRHFKLLSRLDVLSGAFTAKNTAGLNFIDALKQQHDVKFFGLARNLTSTDDAGRPLDPFHLTSSTLNGGETRIGDCLRQALKETRGQSLAAVVLVSDGRQNAGEDAVQAAHSFKTQRVPIFTVGIGDPAEPKDFEVTFEGPDMILPDDWTEGTALIRYRGYTDIHSITVDMKHGDKVVASVEVKLGKPGEKLPVPLRFKESKPGKYTYTINIPEQPGELRTDNNHFTYNFQVVDKKVKVLFVEGQDLPRWEYRYLKNALRRDHTSEVDVLLATSDGAFLWDGTEGKPALDHFPVNKREMAAYDVLIIGDLDPAIFTSEQVTLVRDFVREGGGMIMIAGERFAPRQYTQGVWAEMLPVVPQGAPFQAPDSGFQDAFQVELTDEGRKQAWTHLDNDDTVNREVWENLPRLYWYYPVKRKKSLATVIAVHPYDKDEEGHKMPLIVTMPYGSGRTMYIGVDSLWRWRKPYGDRYHYRFYNQAIRYLSLAKRLGGQKRYYLGVDRNLVALGDKVVVTAMLKDENFNDLTTETAAARGKTPKGEDFIVELHALHDRPGSYEGNYFPALAGEFTMWLRDEAQPEARQAELFFRSEKPQLEYENPRLDEELLQNVARAGGDGGMYFSVDRMRELPPKIQLREDKIPREIAYDLWDNWVVFGVFLGALTLEWILRKRGRML